MVSKTLSREDKNFFSLVSQAIYANPFSDDRIKLDAKIAGLSYSQMAKEQNPIDLFLPHVNKRLKKIESKGLNRIQHFTGKDRRYMEYAWLFSTYHKYIEDFDKLIQTQLKEGDKSSRVPFANKVLRDLESHGFPIEKSLYYFSSFYQIRRAFYFIGKNLTGKSPSMKRLRLAIWNNVFTHDIRLYYDHLLNRMEDFSTLFLGETGTGKGTAASAIGRSGYIAFNEKKNVFEESFTSTFLSINLSQFPESLIESELFGHKKGSFTGAVEDHPGIFTRSSRCGSLFLDEIGEVSIPIQIKLLQVLQDRTFSPVGSHEKKRFKGRVIAATNKPLEQLRSSGSFRDDFFYRLCSDIITVPPLRLRIAEDPAELNDLINLTVSRILGEKTGQSAPISEMIRKTIHSQLPDDYPWPGNVRELEQAVRRILLTGSYSGDIVRPDKDTLTGLVNGIQEGSLNAQDLMSRYVTLLYKRSGTYEEVARKTKLDRRTVKKYIETPGED